MPQAITRRFALLITLGAALAACGGGGNSASPPASTDPQGWNAVTTLRSTDSVVGTGATPSIGKLLSVNYTGWLYDVRVADLKGARFDASTAPFGFNIGVGQVIKGWDQGLADMKVGGKRTLIIPASLAYGASGNGPIPPNAALVFDVELISVK